MSYDVISLRQDLAATIAALRDKDNPMPIDRAKAIADVAQVVINSAKVEVDMINALGRGRVEPTGFLQRAKDTLERQEKQPEQLGGPAAPAPTGLVGRM